ncbi:MAG: MucR family transcriptional regulator [Magnetococcales bacterium]|nr:MucR family transcriptional regulator [Magnetococcales bacterium]MBF0151873.1 MucR family transcriptional regulator [Magnetococcales bacterium]MBF0172523.1 MucR family transcriptional regulator [Magnetococcales bacterium]MBF0347049.1 MucR family transcriptional regulator [Magnetococcales bacterium]MBF0632923.1 MucR family transcriptional regulator [Magnetococcales bacterium]
MNLKFTAEIVQAYVANNEIPATEIPGLIQSVHRTLSILSEDSGSLPGKDELMDEILIERTRKKAATMEDIKPFVDPSLAISENAVICLICGKELKAMKGHLSRTHGMDINAYRRRFHLDGNFPMVAPAYSEKRRQLAKETRLGERPGS